MGSNLRTLAQSNPVMTVNDASFRLLEVGNNGPAGIMAGSAATCTGVGSRSL